MKQLIKSLLPQRIHDALRDRQRRKQAADFFNQKTAQLTCGAFTIDAPEKHLLFNLQSCQPYRDLCVGITAKYITEKYPDAHIVDIGANIGDTAAIIATYTCNPLILVEGSSYFFRFLESNASKLPNHVTLRNELVSNGEPTSGSFSYWGGTASFHERAGTGETVATQRLSSIANDKTRFVKIDTDGYDFAILLDGMNWIAAQKPAVLFENQIRNDSDFVAANDVFMRLGDSGYSVFVVWDDAGMHLVTTGDRSVLFDLNRYLFKVFEREQHRSIYNYDVLCVHRDDEDVGQQVSEWFRQL